LRKAPARHKAVFGCLTWLPLLTLIELRKVSARPRDND
jgi:hypothetical protein